MARAPKEGSAPRVVERKGTFRFSEDLVSLLGGEQKRIKNRLATLGFDGRRETRYRGGSQRVGWWLEDHEYDAALAALGMDQSPAKPTVVALPQPSQKSVEVDPVSDEGGDPTFPNGWQVAQDGMTSGWKEAMDAYHHAIELAGKVPELRAQVEDQRRQLADCQRTIEELLARLPKAPSG